MKYIYILQSVKTPDQVFSGMTDNIESVITKHNGRQVPDTAKYAPFNLRTYLAFADEGQARGYDHYLKTEQGRAYLKKRL